MKNFLLIFLISLFFMNCENSIKNTKKPNFQDRILGNVMGTKRLELTANFNECGEWGGHTEKINIYRENGNLFAEYVEDSVDCKKLYEINRKISEKQTLKLNYNHEKEIYKYLKSIFEVGLKMDLPCHSGEYYQAAMSDSSFILKYNCAKSSWDKYERLKIELNK